MSLVFLCALLLQGAADAQAAQPPRAFFGVDPVSIPTAPQLERAARGGVGSVRFPLSWSDSQPAPGGPIDWNQMDQLVAAGARLGIEVMPILYGTPSWVSASHTNLPVSSAAQRQLWTEFAQAAVRRYGPGGEFWALHGPGSSDPVPNAPIHTWQIWNEENYFYFTSHPSPRAYAQLLKISSAAIRGIDPAAKLILGGMFGRPNASLVGGQAMFATKFLDRLYRIRGIKKTFDGVALHPYTATTALMIRQVRDMREIMRANRDARTGFYLTELGWGSGNNSPLDKGLAGQATELTKAFAALKKRRSAWKIRTVYWYSLQDELPDQGCEFCDTTGLFTHSYEPKPAWFAFAQTAGGLP